MVDEIRIRRYQEADKESVFALHLTAFAGRGIRVIDKYAAPSEFSDIEKNYFQNDGYFYIAEHGGRVVGMGGLRRFDNDTAELKSLRVHPDFKGHGISKKLLLAREEKARELGYKSLIFDTRIPQAEADKLYQGFKLFKTDTQDGLPVLYYKKILTDKLSHDLHTPSPPR